MSKKYCEIAPGSDPKNPLSTIRRIAIGKNNIVIADNISVTIATTKCKQYFDA